MKILEDKVLQKMNLQRLKAHRTSVLAYISSRFNEYDRTDDHIRYPIDRDTQEFKDAIAYRNKVNKYYDNARISRQEK